MMITSSQEVRDLSKVTVKYKLSNSKDLTLTPLNKATLLSSRLAKTRASLVFLF